MPAASLSVTICHLIYVKGEDRSHPLELCLCGLLPLSLCPVVCAPWAPRTPAGARRVLCSCLPRERFLAQSIRRKVRAQHGSFCWLVWGFMSLLVMGSGPAQWCCFQGGLGSYLVPLMAPESNWPPPHPDISWRTWVLGHCIRCSHLTSSGR